MRPVTGDAVRRTIVKSGYVNSAGQPVTDPTQFATATTFGCLECHEVFEGHGGNRVNNVQVCVVCHNVNNTSSGRTITGSPINPAITGLIPQGSTTPLGSDPLLYPEVANNFKELIHGIHSFATPGKAIPFVDVRNFTSGGFAGVLVYGPEITYPGNLRHCTKCHYANTVPAGIGAITQSYKAELPASVLPTTQKITTGNPAETAADIEAARTAVPNQTDLVNTPISSACYYCHTSDVRADHFRLQGGMIAAQRSTVDLTAAPLFLTPDVLATP
jgi:OmcA/MtrC family decaheme c-type cytochrome